MATREELYQALRNADAAGDAEGARKLAAYIQSMPSEQPAKPVEKDSSTLAGLGKGAAMGLADVGNTVINAAMKLPGVPESARQWNRTRNADMEYIADSNKGVPFTIGRIGANVAATLPVGGALGSVVKPFAPALGNAIATGGFKAGQVAAGAPLMAKAANLFTRMTGGAITGGAATALVSPDNAGKGAAWGAVLPPALAGIGNVARHVGGSLAIGDANRVLAKKAIEEYGIPLGVGDIAQGGTIRAIRSILNDAPLSGGIGAAQREATQKGFNKAVGGTFGAPETELTAGVMDAAKKRMGAEFDRIWNNNALQVDGQMAARLIDLQKQAGKLPNGEGASLSAEVSDLLSKIQHDAAGNPVIPGDVANKFQSYLRRRAEGSSGLKNELSDLRESIISAFNRSVGQADAAALTSNRAQYKAYKTVEKLLNGAEAGVAGRNPGDVPAALLPQAVVRNYSQPAGAPLTDLAQIGSRFLVDRTPKTGGSMRAALQNSMLGAGVAYGGFTNPALAAASIPTAAGVNAMLGSPAIAKLFMDAQLPSQLSRIAASPAAARIPYLAAPPAIARQ